MGSVMSTGASNEGACGQSQHAETRCVEACENLTSKSPPAHLVEGLRAAPGAAKVLQSAKTFGF